MKFDEPTHAGGVVFRTVESEFRFLLVHAKSPDEEWVLPKGHIEKGESAEQAALREVREESGVTGKIHTFLGYTDYTFGIEKIHVAIYLMSFVSENAPSERRATRWCKLEDALERLTFKDSTKLLVQANEILKRSD